MKQPEIDHALFSYEFDFAVIKKGDIIQQTIFPFKDAWVYLALYVSDEFLVCQPLIGKGIDNSRETYFFARDYPNKRNKFRVLR